MARPRLLSLLPNRFKEWAYYRHYLTRHQAWLQLFRRAPLALCPSLAMYDLVVGDVLSGCIAFTGFYEWRLTKHIAQYAAQGGLLVDVGANMGYFSLLWVGLSRSGKAIAVEPAPRNIALFRSNVQRNRLEKRITLIPKAASNRAGTVGFDVGPSDQTGWGGVSMDSANAISVPSLRLDEELSGKRIDVLKIDAEGADTLILQGCEGLLADRRIKIIYFEQNEPRMKLLGIAPGTAQEFLQRQGYNCVSLGTGEEQWLAYPD